MVKNQLKLNKFYQELIKKENIPYKKALAIYEALHKEAVSLKIINSKDILDGLEIDIRIAKVLNPVRSKSRHYVGTADTQAYRTSKRGK